MARKTTGSTTASRKKKNAIPVSPDAGQVVPEIPSNGKSTKVVSINVEEEIRRRAYELYLERRATAGSADGDENQDWLMAEREVRSRLGDREQHSA